ncbi:unnamed protein product, partial [Polarella glacialis]
AQGRARPKVSKRPRRDDWDALPRGDVSRGNHGSGVTSTPAANPALAGPLRELLLSAMPDDGTLQAVKDCLGTVQVLACQLLGDSASVVVQGSYGQGLALRGSDLDVAVIVGKPDDRSKKPDDRSKKPHKG